MRSNFTLSLLAILASSSFMHAQWNYDWASQSISPNVETATACAVSPDGHVAVTGAAQSDMQWGTFSGDGLPGNGARGFVTYLDPAGAFQWAHVFSSAGDCQAWDVALDGDGNVFVGGQFHDSLRVDGVSVLAQPDTAFPGAAVFYIVKLSTTGNLLWAGTVGLEGYTGELRAIAVDGNGDVYAVGEGGFDYGRFAKLDGATGSVLFSLSPVGAGAYIQDVTTDADNNVYIVGQATNAFTMGGLSCPYNNALGVGCTPLFIGKFNSAGVAQWYYVPDQTGSGYSPFPEGNIAVTADGYSFVETRKRVRVLGDTLADGNGTTQGLFALDPLGQPIWARKLNTTGQLAVNDIHCDSQGNVLLAGQSYGPTINMVDTVINSSNNGLNVFLGRYDGTTGGINGLLNGPALQDVMGVGMDANDVPVICGTAPGSAQLGSTTITGSWNVFVSRLGSTTGVEEIASDRSLTIVPNPSSGIFRLTAQQSRDALDLEVMDARGEVVMREHLNAPVADISVDVPSGLYLLKVRDADGSMTCSRVMIQR